MFDTVSIKNKGELKNMLASGSYDDELVHFNLDGSWYTTDKEQPAWNVYRVSDLKQPGLGHTSGYGNNGYKHEKAKIIVDNLHKVEDILQYESFMQDNNSYSVTTE